MAAKPFCSGAMLGRCWFAVAGKQAPAGSGFCLVLFLSSCPLPRPVSPKRRGNPPDGATRVFFAFPPLRCGALSGVAFRASLGGSENTKTEKKKILAVGFLLSCFFRFSYFMIYIFFKENYET